MTILSNASLAMSNVSYVFSQQNAYTSLELYAIVVAMFVIFIGYSLYLNPKTHIFEKLISSIMALGMSFSIIVGSFSLAKIEIIQGGSVATLVSPSIGISADTYAVVPSIIMQNTNTLSITACFMAVLTFIYVIHCIILFKDISVSKVGVMG